ncbi:MAG: hypothetical protein AAFR47_24030 [Pseudomonadota bacterium]
MWKKATAAKLTLVLGIAAGLAGCIDPRDYESVPVEVSTRDGIVTCQLYTRERVIWDRSIDRPRSMSVQAADEVCIEEGKRHAGIS